MGTPLPKEKVKVGIIHPNEIDSHSIYDYAHYLGTLEMQQNTGLADSQIIRKLNVYDGDPAASEGAIRDCISDGANVILAMSWGYMNVCEKLAEEFPNVVFAHATGYKYNNHNFANFSAKLYQARYLSGIAAGLATKSNKIGYVAAMGNENSEVSGGINAFAIGVEEANPNAEIFIRVTYSWFDPMGETEAANLLIDTGCDVIAAHCNTPMPQRAAQRAGVLSIGFNSDMMEDAPDSVITSVMTNWGALYTYLIESVINGTYDAVPHFFGLAEKAVEITPLNVNLVHADTRTAVEEARRRIIEESYNVFDGILLTNNGKTVGEEGKTLSDEIILGGIDWYYRNVIVIK